MDTRPDAPTPAPSSRSQLPESAANPGRMFIEIEYHPHSGLDKTIISLDTAASIPSTTPRPRRSIVPQGRHPWAPFRSRADFEWAETMYQSSPDNIKKQLNGIHGSWNPHGTAITIKTPDELRAYLEKAHHYVVEVIILTRLLSDT